LLRKNYELFARKITVFWPTQDIVSDKLVASLKKDSPRLAAGPAGDDADEAASPTNRPIVTMAERIQAKFMVFTQQSSQIHFAHLCFLYKGSDSRYRPHFSDG